MPRCGSQCTLCDLPVSFDTYTGCSHACAYCFAKKAVDISKIGMGESVGSLRNFIEGKRDTVTAWCDWPIPIHWGGMSDPFQPAEAHYKRSLECLELLVETQYPFLVSTKGRLAVTEPYITLLSQANCVVQVSLVCPSFDKFEKGCPPYAERLEMVRKLSAVCKRVIVRIQPYMLQYFKEVNQSIRDVAEAGAYGVIVEGMKFIKKQKNTVKVGGDWCYRYEDIKQHFDALKKTAHDCGIKIYAGENRLRRFGDSLTCCGVDGMEGFKPNTFNLNHIMHGDDVRPTAGMKKVGTAMTFKALYQDTLSTKLLKQQSFAGKMLEYAEKNRESQKVVFGLDRA